LDATEIPERINVTRVANLVGVPVQSLIDALTRKTIFAHCETVVCKKKLTLILTINYALPF